MEYSNLIILQEVHEQWEKSSAQMSPSWSVLVIKEEKMKMSLLNIWIGSNAEFLIFLQL